MFYDYFWLIWVLSSILFIRFYFYLIANHSKLVAKPMKERFGTPRILFQVTTKGNIGIVQETVNRVNQVCAEIKYKKYEVWVVTDADEKFEGCRTIVVPPNYSCQNAIHKGRALQYAVETRRKENKNGKDIYVFHLDDESLITKQTLCSLLSYLEDNPKPISEGLITYPMQPKEEFKISNLMDTLRPFCCYECLALMSGGNPAYIHGSNLLVRSDIEDEVEWTNGATLAEDSLFAINARVKYGPLVFGWHGGVVEEKSPLTVKDLIKQRRRWFYGLIMNLKYFQRWEKVRQMGRGLIWMSGLFSGIASIFAFFVFQSIPLEFRMFFAVTSFMWLFSYQIGAHLNGKYLPLKRRITFHFLALICALVIGILECLVPVISIFRKPKTFEVIQK